MEEVTPSADPPGGSEEPRPHAESDWLATFSRWLHQLPADVLALSDALARPETPEPLRRGAASVIGHLHRSFELIPEGLEGLGYLDHAFAARALARDVLAGDEAEEDLRADGAAEVLARLARETDLVSEFLGDDGADFVAACAARAAAGVGDAPEALLDDGERCASVCAEVCAWARDYRPPELGRGEEDLLQIRSFMRTRTARLRDSFAAA